MENKQSEVKMERDKIVEEVKAKETPTEETKEEPAEQTEQTQ